MKLFCYDFIMPVLVQIVCMKLFILCYYSILDTYLKENIAGLSFLVPILLKL